MRPTAAYHYALPQHEEAARTFLHAVNEERRNRGLRPVATHGKAKTVRKALVGYFTLGLTLRHALHEFDRLKVLPEPEFLYPTRVAKLALRGQDNA